ncbi:MCE family protein, partial [Mycobacterium sp. ACS4331]|uniref:MCE family protein n=1 Tax=Mycobacterium sp. ACS4331 TaxID=1834121 RepID=UPI0007FF4B83
MISHRIIALIVSTAVLTAGCSFGGPNSVPLPGTVGRGPGAQLFHVEIANVGTLEPNSPVLIDDVVVGTIGSMTVAGWHARVDVWVKPDVPVPANTVATVGQTSLLGSMHLALNPPPGEPPRGRLESGATIGLNATSTYPSTEQTLSSLSALVNGGGLGQIGDVLSNAAEAVTGRADDIRELLTRLNDIVTRLDDQRDEVIGSIRDLDRLSATLAGQEDVLDRALKEIPPALEVLVAQRPNITAALRSLGEFSRTATGVVADIHDDLITNLKNLEPTLRVLADVGPDLGSVLAYLPTYPLTQDIIDRGVRGDYMNLFAVIDLTVPRLKRTSLLGTRFGVPRFPLEGAPGDPWYANYTYDPLGVPVVPVPPATPPEVPAADPAVPPPALPAVSPP